ATSPQPRQRVVEGDAGFENEVDAFGGGIRIGGRPELLKRTIHRAVARRRGQRGALVPGEDRQRQTDREAGNALQGEMAHRTPLGPDYRTLRSASFAIITSVDLTIASASSPRLSFNS